MSRKANDGPNSRNPEAQCSVALQRVVFLALSPARYPKVSVDETAFRIYVNGEVVGREEFSIRQAGAGGQAQLILRGTVDLDLPSGPIDLAPDMIMDAGNQGASTYRIKISGSETTEIRSSDRRWQVSGERQVGNRRGTSRVPGRFGIGDSR